MKVRNKNKQQILKRKLKAKFINNFLRGYFEFFIWPDNNIYFSDYNRILADLVDINNFNILKGLSHLQGVCGSKGRARGRVVIVSPQEISSKKFSHNGILVCRETSPEYLPLMKKAAAIITENGGILSHAAVVARELGIPCVVSVKNATKILKEGQQIELDATKGIIKFL